MGRPVEGSRASVTNGKPSSKLVIEVPKALKQVKNDVPYLPGLGMGWRV
jgi:hypothetical protein